MRVFIVLIFFVYTCILKSQNRYTGAIEEMMENSHNKTYSWIKDEILEKPFVLDHDSIDLSAYLPLPEDQGMFNNTCVAYACVYGMASFLFKNPHRKKYVFFDSIHYAPHLENIFHPIIPYSIYIKEKYKQCNEPIITSDFLKRALNYYQLPTLTSVPLDSQSCQSFMSKYVLTKSDVKTKYNTLNLESLEDVKKSLEKGFPVVLVMRISTTWFNVMDRINSPSGNHVWMNEDKDCGEPSCNHAMIIVGYNELTRTLKVMNSYGRHWGANGYFWISYDRFDLFPIPLFIVPIKEKSGFASPIKINEFTQMNSPSLLGDSNTLIRTWMKKNYYVPYGRIEIVLRELKDDYAYIYIKDRGNKNVRDSFELTKKSTATFQIDKHKYRISYREKGNIKGDTAINAAMFFTIEKE